MRESQKNFLIGLIFLLFGLAAFFIIIPSQVKIGGHVHGLPPTFFPRVASGLITFFAIFLIVGSVRQEPKLIKDSFAQLATSFSNKENVRTAKNLMMVFLICIAYYIGFIKFGFIYTTVVILMALALALGWRKYITLILMSVSVTFIVNYLFETAMQIPLP